MDIYIIIIISSQTVRYLKRKKCVKYVFIEIDKSLYKLLVVIMYVYNVLYNYYKNKIILNVLFVDKRNGIVKFMILKINFLFHHYHWVLV